MSFNIPNGIDESTAPWNRPDAPVNRCFRCDNIGWAWFGDEWLCEECRPCDILRCPDGAHPLSPLDCCARHTDEGLAAELEDETLGTEEWWRVWKMVKAWRAA